MCRTCSSSEMPPEQSEPPHQAEREALSRVPRSPASIKEKLTGYQTETLTAQHILCHPRYIALFTQALPTRGAELSLKSD